MFVTWVLLVVAVVFLVLLLGLSVRYWQTIPPMIRWFAGLNALVLVVNILCMGLSIQQQNLQEYRGQVEVNVERGVVK